MLDVIIAQPTPRHVRIETLQAGRKFATSLTTSASVWMVTEQIVDGKVLIVGLNSGHIEYIDRLSNVFPLTVVTPMETTYSQETTT